MRKYDSYKDSGIEWIGEIPGHWEIQRFGHLFSFSRGLGITKQDLKEKGIPCVNYGEIHSKYGFKVDPQIHRLKCVEESYLETSEGSLLRRGDFVFADTSEDIEGSGNFTVLDSDVPTFAGYHTIIARLKNRKDYKYLAYCFDSLEFRNQIRSAVSGVKVFSITQGILKDLKVQLPSHTEQSAIASYLDRKTAEIDELIADKKRLLELYEEEKTAVINQAVTKGINPDVPMKDSGIEWLGEIPEHWEVKKVKWVHRTTSGGTPKTSDSENYGGDIPWLRTLDLNSDKVYQYEITITEKALSESSAKIVPANSVLVAMYGGAGTIGKSGLLKFDAAINQAICAILPNKNTWPEYLHYFVVFFRPHWMVGAEGTRRDPNISQDDIKNKGFIFPPFEEQQSIVHHIEAECARIDAKISNTKKLIELLTEYRTALISEVVTGKVKIL